MTHADIQIFFAVLECGSIARAAKKLFISQTTLSARLRALEAELNAPLFYRGKGVRITEPTPFGLRFIPIAEKWESLWQETISCGLHTQHRQLSLSAVRSINSYVMAHAYSRYAISNPDVNLQITTNRSTVSAQLVERDGVDAAFISEPQHSRNTRVLPVFREKMVCVSRREELPPQSVTPLQLDPGNEIRMNWGGEYQNWYGYWFPAGALPRVQTDDISLILPLLETADCWSIVPKSVACALEKNGHVQSYPLTAPPPDRTTYLLTRRDYFATEDLKAFMKELQGVIISQGSEWLYQSS